MQQEEDNKYFRSFEQIEKLFQVEGIFIYYVSTYKDVCSAMIVADDTKTNTENFMHITKVFNSINIELKSISKFKSVYFIEFIFPEYRYHQIPIAELKPRCYCELKDHLSCHNCKYFGGLDETCFDFILCNEPKNAERSEKNDERKIASKTPE